MSVSRLRRRWIAPTRRIYRQVKQRRPRKEQFCQAVRSVAASSVLSMSWETSRLEENASCRDPDKRTTERQGNTGGLPRALIRNRAEKISVPRYCYIGRDKTV